MKWRNLIIYPQSTTANICYWSSTAIKCNFIKFLLWVKRGISALFPKSYIFLWHYPCCSTLCSFLNPKTEKQCSLSSSQLFGHCPLQGAAKPCRFLTMWSVYCKVCNNYLACCEILEKWNISIICAILPPLSTKVVLFLSSRLICCGFCLAVSAKHKICHVFISVSLSHLSPAFNFPLGSPFLSPLYGSNFNNPSPTRALFPKKYFTVHIT